MTGIMQAVLGGSFAPAVPTTIGQAWGGGYYAGQIAVGGGGVATHYLIVAPKATGQSASLEWGSYGVTTGITSVINGPANTTSLNALGSAYKAAQYCVGLNAGAGLNGYTDWYLPAKNELETVYYFLKPGTQTNYNGSGANANAVSPEPINTNHTTYDPSRTTATNFQTGGSEAFNIDGYWTSTENDNITAFYQLMDNGNMGAPAKYNNAPARAVRRIPV